MNQEIIDKGTLRIHQPRVLSAAHRELGVIVARDVLDEIEGRGTRDEELAHVGYVEEPGLVSHRRMFLCDGGVLNRQFKTRERDHTPAQGYMLVIKSSLLKRLGIDHGFSSLIRR